MDKYKYKTMIDEKILKQREAGKKWRVNNKEKIKAWRAQNKEKILETQRKWRLKNYPERNLFQLREK